MKIIGNNSNKKPELPLARPAVNFAEWDFEDGTNKIRIRLGGHFSTQSTVVVEAAFVWGGFRLVNFSRIDRRGISTNAFTGQQSGSFTEAVPVWIEGSLLGYRTVRVTATRLHPDDWIDVQFFQGNSPAPANHRTVLTGANVDLAGAGAYWHSARDAGPSYVITEEPDDPVAFLQG